MKCSDKRFSMSIFSRLGESGKTSDRRVASELGLGRLV